MKGNIQTCPRSLANSIFPVLIALVLAGVPARGAFIDSFEAGPQSHLLGPGDAYWGESVNGLDPAQALGGGRRLTLLADSDAPFRAIEEGAFSVVLSGATPGSLIISAAVVTLPESSSYEPAVLLDYDCPASNWSGFDRIVIRFNAPPTADVMLQTSLESGDDAYWADTPVPGGSQSAVVLFSGLSGAGAVQVTSVTSLRLKWVLPALAAMTLEDMQLAGSVSPELPQLKIQLGGGVNLSWTTNAVGFFLESSADLATPFTKVTVQPVVSGTNYLVTLPGALPAMYFRLHNGD